MIFFREKHIFKGGKDYSSDCFVFFKKHSSFLLQVPTITTNQGWDSIKNTTEPLYTFPLQCSPDLSILHMAVQTSLLTVHS